MSSVRTHVRHRRKIILGAAIGIFLLLAGTGALLVSESRNYVDCQRYNYNDKLNGGVKEIGGRKYTINICGSGVNSSHFFGDSMDVVQLTISDERGVILAKRHYKVFWEGQPGHEPLTIGQDRITYQDDEKQADYTIAMPPTTIDWIRARLPFIN
ncbi:TPA: hypothetical protein ACU9T0_006026 [Burkholderia cenocepacia]|uniref:DUF4352 domain-containing protein n=1 Tax=Burkholderia vietnamiensis TaxID=60552 RepID=A0ABS1AXC6_BURVI|nr:hypothetical protein [Burkholderia vietnamiensis]MBJ9688814.1 hypothetical protein [Burkholderia vietnamiensis]